MRLRPDDPRPHKAVEAGIAPVASELSKFIDIALDKIYRFGGGQNIILSSFTPEVCILLAIKQQAYPVMLITSAGKLPVTEVEVRVRSLKVAVCFAEYWNLAGVVFTSETLLLCLRLVNHATTLGLSWVSCDPVNIILGNAVVSLRVSFTFIRHSVKRTTVGRS